MADIYERMKHISIGKCPICDKPCRIVKDDSPTGKEILANPEGFIDGDYNEYYQCKVGTKHGQRILLEKSKPDGYYNMEH